MKLLNISSIQIFPPNDGGARLIFTFLKYLSYNHSISLVTVKTDEINKENIENIMVYDVLDNNSIKKFLSLKTVFDLIRIVKKEKPELIIIDFPWFGVYGFILQKIFGVNFFIHEHNIEYVRFKREGKWWWKLLFWYEKFVYKKAKKILCISPVDERLLIENLKVPKSKIIDCPYGIDSEVFYPNKKVRKKVREKIGLRDDEGFILFFGKLDYLPNIKALKIINEEIVGRLEKKNNNFKIIVCGKNPPALFSNNKIIFTGYVKKIEDYINASDLIIVPLTSGGGMRTKIIESIACGKRVISTKIGAEGIDESLCSELLQIVENNDWDTFTKKIEESINNKKLFYKVPKKFREKYLWQNIISGINFSD
ncbi:MAG: glycosyltransferase family 4 protein [Candidatus Pacebacteria bacterium]|nr:glycosyltransferase family 4 protein [Candidatus Paceibacterota bacterium]